MTIEELLVKIVAAIFSIGAILVVIYFINKKALEKATRMNEEFLMREEEQKEIEKNNEVRNKVREKKI